VSEPDISRFNGIERSAVLLMALGEDNAAEILKNMEPREVQNIGAAMTSLKDITTEELRGVLGVFLQETHSITTLGLNSNSYIRGVMNKALGPEKGNSLVDRLMSNDGVNGLESLKWMDANTIAEMVKKEHPQVIAVVLGFLESEHAAEVISELPTRLQTDVIIRLSSAEGVQSEALLELNNILDDAAITSSVSSSDMGGVKTAADILNLVQGGVDQDILSGIDKMYPDLKQQIEDQMFVFADLVDIDDRGVQTMLRDIPTERLVLALKGADEIIKDKFVSNMSKRAAEMMLEDMEVMPPVKLSEVEDAQKEILVIVRKLADDGTIALGGAGGEEYV
jgi:flagellar motor switch protein FliG